MSMLKGNIKAFKLYILPQDCNFIKNETLAQVFSCEFAKFLRTPFFTEHLRWLLLFCVS